MRRTIFVILSACALDTSAQSGSKPGAANKADVAPAPLPPAAGPMAPGSLAPGPLAPGPMAPERGRGTGVTEKIAPQDPTPQQCNLNYAGQFGIAVMKPNVRMTNNVEQARADIAKAAAMKKAGEAGLPMFPGLGAVGGLVQKERAPAVMQKQNVVPLVQPTTPAAVNAAPTPPTKLTDGDDPVKQPNGPGLDTPLTTNVTSTRTMTRTVTVQRTIMDLKPMIAVGTANAFLVSQIGDGQIQAPTLGSNFSITTLSTPAAAPPAPAPLAPAPPAPPAPTTPLQSVVPVSQIADGQVQAPVNVVGGLVAAAAKAVAAPKATNPPAAPQKADKALSIPAKEKRQAPAGSVDPAAPVVQLVSCKQGNTLTMTLKDGVLVDNKGRTGYIASNFQFQFDAPPQSGSIYTAGFSVCNNGSLALGKSTTWYQCLSGDFYNLYDRWWAAQCQPVTINAVMLKDC